MKQAELDKLLNTVSRLAAKSARWQFSRGFVFRTEGFLFFMILIGARAKGRDLWWSLMYKPLQFDDLFWTIVQLEENAKRPLSFRACGAWTAPATTIAEGLVPVVHYEEDETRKGVDRIISECDAKVNQLSSEVCDLQDNIALVERTFEQLLEKYPNTAKNIWVERLLTAILTKEFDKARSIVQDRREKRDSGGFMVNTDTFFDLANNYLDE